MSISLRPRRRLALKGPIVVVLAAVFVTFLVCGFLLYRQFRPGLGRLSLLRRYWEDPEAHSEWTLRSGERCPEAPFVMPTDGLVGFSWGDSFRPGHRHQGLDIFGPTGPAGLGQTPVVAAYDGYLTRLSDWRSAVIIRVPDDPLVPGRQIWIYYSHMADPQGNSYILPAFPQGTRELRIAAGTLIGYQGNYSGDPDSPTGMHLHFSIVLDNGRGTFRNELEFSNTVDPAPYLGLASVSGAAGKDVLNCRQGELSH